MMNTMANDSYNGRMLLLPALSLFFTACAAIAPINPNGPRRNEPPYPVLLNADPQRAAAAATAWANLLHEKPERSKSSIALQPVTGTIRNLPDNPTSFLYLPKVGTGTAMNEEETAESLRRFLNETQQLTGADPAQLSLVQQQASADGTRTAIYEQRVFSYPLAEGYGKVEIHFTADRRVLNLTSTAIPNADKIQTALNLIKPSLKWEEVAKQLGGQTFSYSDKAGSKLTYTIGQGNQINVEQLVVYPLPSPNSDALEFHVAWQVNLTNAPVGTIYVDAVKNEVIATALRQST
jgi:hypothetical protein